MLAELRNIMQCQIRDPLMKIHSVCGSWLRFTTWIIICHRLPDSPATPPDSIAGNLPQGKSACRVAHRRSTVQPGAASIADIQQPVFSSSTPVLRPGAAGRAGSVLTA